MNRDLEAALTELDACTAALLNTDFEDRGVVARLLATRTGTIQRVLLAIDATGGRDAAVFEWLAAALAQGEHLSRRAFQAKQELLQEWGRLQQVAGYCDGGADPGGCE